jgi:hypothetical protein
MSLICSVKLWYIHPYNGILFRALKKKKATKPLKEMEEPFFCYFILAALEIETPALCVLGKCGTTK